MASSRLSGRAAIWISRSAFHWPRGGADLGSARVGARFTPTAGFEYRANGGLLADCERSMRYDCVEKLRFRA
ncbi:MAG: hypothetical protein GKR99_16375 [Rhodobacteraceae bacterium]|nr:hypothetical protein [Paracoccaceae bacterium]